MAIGVFSVINGFQNHTKPFVGAIVAKTTGAIGEKVCSLFETDTKIQQVPDSSHSKQLWSCGEWCHL